MKAPNKGNENWPALLKERYCPVKPLGRGAFGTVWLAQRRERNKGENGDGTTEGRTSNDLVAVKSVGSYNFKTRTYARREVDILRELRNHRNIVQLLAVYRQQASSSSSANGKAQRPFTFLVMSYARGPTLRQLLDKGGALGLPLCRLVARDLISAVSHLHGHAVIHRDIKPDNCILAHNHPSCELKEDLDDIEIYGSSNSNKQDDNNNEDLHSHVGSKFRVVLIDFGFARALSPAEMEESKRHQIQQQSTMDKSLQNGVDDGWDVGIHDVSSHSIANALQDIPRVFENDEQDNHDNNGVEIAKKEGEDVLDVSSSSRRRQNATKSLRRLTSLGRISSAERILVRGLSALGTEAYAAPEVKAQARDKHSTANKGGSTTIKSMTDCVANYGMAVDAYSVGSTLREALTGVPPNRRLGAGDLNGGFSVWKKAFGRTRRRSRAVNQIPAQAIELVQGLTRVQVEDRLTVSEARQSAWIADNQDGVNKNHEENENGSNDTEKETQRVVFLKCVQN